MSQPESPTLPLPVPLRAEEEGTFTHYSVVTRLPDIGRRILAENRFLPPVAEELQDFFRSIPYGLISPLDDSGAPDAGDWRRYVAPYLGDNWLQVPWFFAEAYFYRRVLAITGYFQEGSGQGVDPYRYQKQQGLETTRQAIRALAGKLLGWLQVPGLDRHVLTRLLTLALWGNQSDLSLWPADVEDRSTQVDADRRPERLLVDEVDAVVEHIAGLEGHPARLDFIADNAGFELVCDLALTDYLLGSGAAASVWVHVKSHPTFVSDAMAGDVRDTVAFLAGDGDPAPRTLGARLADHLDAGRLVLADNFFWTSPLAAWEMPPALREHLAGSALVISKGDANYRRLLGDRHWPHTTPFADVVGYFPAPLVALRTCKSEVGVGLPPGRAEQAAAQDPDWLVNGQWGMIQFRA